MTFCSGSSSKPLNLWRNEPFCSWHQLTGCWPDFASCSFWDFSVSRDSEETRLSRSVSFLLHQSHRWMLCFRGNGAAWRVVRGTDQRCESLLRRAGRWTVNANTRQTNSGFLFFHFVLHVCVDFNEVAEGGQLLLLCSDQRAVTRIAPRNKAVCLRQGSPKLEREIKLTKLAKQSSLFPCQTISLYIQVSVVSSYGFSHNVRLF